MSRITVEEAITIITRTGEAIYDAIQDDGEMPSQRDTEPVIPLEPIPLGASAGARTSATNRNLQKLVALDPDRLVDFFWQDGGEINPQALAALEHMAPDAIALVLKRLLGAEHTRQFRALQIISKLGNRGLEYPQIARALVDEGVLARAIEAAKRADPTGAHARQLEGVRAIVEFAQRTSGGGNAAEQEVYAVGQESPINAEPSASFSPAVEPNADVELANASDGPLDAMWAQVNEDDFLTKYLNGDLEFGDDENKNQAMHLRAQKALSTWTAFVQAMSNISKTLSDTNRAIVRNMA